MLRRLRSGRLIVVNYAHNGYHSSQQLCSETAMSHGEADRVLSMGFTDLSLEFREQNQAILVSERGAGWWCWKPEVILNALEQVGPRDVLVYVDCGWKFKTSVRWTIDKLKTNQLLFAEAIPQIEGMTTGRRTLLSDCKRYCLDYYKIDPDSPTARQHLVSGGFIAMRNTDDVRSFMKKWKEDMVHDVLMIDDRTDIPKPEYKGFMRHMNDMGPLNALLSTGNMACVIDNETKLEYLERIWPREIRYKEVKPERRLG